MCLSTKHHKEFQGDHQRSFHLYVFENGMNLAKLIHEDIEININVCGIWYT